jgi:hypothetical protein
MYMTEVLGAKCISWNTMDMKNEKCEPATPPTYDSVIVGCKMYMSSTCSIHAGYSVHELVLFEIYKKLLMSGTSTKVPSI